MRGLAVIGLVACGGSPPPPAPPASTVATDAVRESPTDSVVATVAGHPVWASCVVAQAAATHVGRDAALAQCVDFEVLAQAAAARGFADAADPELDEAARAARVNQLVTYEFERKIRTPADLGPLWDRVVQRMSWTVRHEEYRASAYVRVTLEPSATAAQDAEAHRIVDEIAAAVHDRTGLFAVDLFDAGAKVAAAEHVKIDQADVKPYLFSALDTTYATPLWTIPDVGRTTAAVRTKFGWEVILMTDDVAPHNASDDELAAALFPDARLSYFSRWVDELARANKLPTVAEARVKDNLSLLEDGPQ